MPTNQNQFDLLERTEPTQAERWKQIRELGWSCPHETKDGFCTFWHGSELVKVKAERCLLCLRWVLRHRVGIAIKGKSFGQAGH